MEKRSWASNLLILGVSFLFVFAFSTSAVLADNHKGFKKGKLSLFGDCLQAKVITIGDQEIAYYESKGKGKTVVLVHGNSSSSWSYFNQLCGSLGRKYHLVAVDLPGHGRSSNGIDPTAAYKRQAICRPLFDTTLPEDWGHLL